MTGEQIINKNERKNGYYCINEIIFRNRAVENDNKIVSINR